MVILVVRARVTGMADRRHFLRQFGVSVVIALGLALPSARAEEGKPAATAARILPDDAVTQHKMRVGGGEVGYTATAGTLPLRDGKGEKLADVFYVAFMREGVLDAARRPITYAFNGGPGAASAYLDIGALGPRALEFGPGGRMPPVSDHVEDNPDTWLPFTDLVFIDPVGTGYSRATGGTDEVAKRYWGVKQDLDTLAQVIRLHLTRIGRLASPMYLVGESYGGFRAARLAHQLATEEGVAPAGVLMVSPVIEFKLMSGDALDLLPWALRLPSYAAVELETRGTIAPEALGEVERYALTDYLVGLAAGPTESAAAQRLYARVAALIGLSEATVARWEGRVPLGTYVKEFQRSTGRIVSRYDGSVTSPDPDPRAHRNEEDPVLEASIAPFTRAFVAYARDELGFATEAPFELLSREVGRHWDWSSAGGRSSLGASDALRRALAVQSKLRALVAHGMTDLQTPYMMSRYVVDHMPAELRPRVALKLYEGGHMMYLRAGSRHRLRDDALAFYGAAEE
jgi:carboxypeptidase C (cathepsin A)